MTGPSKGLTRRRPNIHSRLDHEPNCAAVGAGAPSSTFRYTAHRLSADGSSSAIRYQRRPTRHCVKLRRSARSPGLPLVIAVTISAAINGPGIKSAKGKASAIESSVPLYIASEAQPPNQVRLQASAKNAVSGWRLISAVLAVMVSCSYAITIGGLDRSALRSSLAPIERQACGWI